MSSQKQEWLFFVPEGTALQAGKDVVLDDDEHHYAAKVLRLGPGDQVMLADGKGTSARGTIAGVEKRATAVKVMSVSTATPPRTRVALLLALPRPQTLWELLPELAELGVDEVIVFPSERTAIKTRPADEKAVKLLREGMRVAKSAWAPHFHYASSIEAAAAKIASATTTGNLGPGQTASESRIELFCDESGIDPHSGKLVAARHAAAVLRESPANCEQIAIWIGTEASFSDAERRFIGTRSNARAVTLGPRILRVPTAVRVAAALVRAHIEAP